MEKLKGLLAAINLKRFNLRWVKHAIWIAALGGLFVYLNVAPPFLAVASQSMEPLLSRGDLILTQSVDPADVHEGDVIVFKVSHIFQEKYGYPPTICHRVVRVQPSGSRLYFRTKGDNNSGEDPFMTSSDNLIGIEKKAAPMLGYGVMFAQSGSGKYFLIGVILLFLLYSNSGGFIAGARKLRSSVAGVSNTEFVKSQGDIEKKIGDMTEKVVQSMNGFSSAMSEYAQHIASHTGAIKSLAAAAQHMESIMSKQDAALESPFPSRKIWDTSAATSISQASPTAVSVPQNAIEVTPELKLAVKEFIFAYNIEHGLTSVEVTPELRTAVWNFIQEYVKNPPLPVPGTYVSAITTVKIMPDSGEIEPEGPDTSEMFTTPHSN